MAKIWSWCDQKDDHTHLCKDVRIARSDFFGGSRFQPDRKRGHGASNAVSALTYKLVSIENLHAEYGAALVKSGKPSQFLDAEKPKHSVDALELENEATLLMLYLDQYGAGCAVND